MKRIIVGFFKGKKLLSIGDIYEIEDFYYSNTTDAITNNKNFNELIEEISIQMLESGGDNATIDFFNDYENLICQIELKKRKMSDKIKLKVFDFEGSSIKPPFKREQMEKEAKEQLVYTTISSLSDLKDCGVNITFRDNNKVDTFSLKQSLIYYDKEKDSIMVEYTNK